jgi:hypothetical protein
MVVSQIPPSAWSSSHVRIQPYCLISEAFPNPIVCLVGHCLSHFFIIVTIYLRKQHNGENIFFGSLSEISIHGWLAPLLLSLWPDRNIMAEGQCQWKPFTLWESGGKERKRKGPGVPKYLSRTCPLPMTCFLLLGPTF